MAPFRFSTFEYYHRHKAADWYWTVGIIAVSLAIVSLIFANVLLALLIILAAFTLMMYAARPPREHDVEITEAGVTVGKYRYSYGNLQSFWLEHTEHVTAPSLLIRTNRTVMPHLLIPVADMPEDEKEQIRIFLRTKIAEVEQHEPLLEQIMEYIGF